MIDKKIGKIIKNIDDDKTITEILEITEDVLDNIDLLEKEEDIYDTKEFLASNLIDYLDDLEETPMVVKLYELVNDLTEV